MTDAGLMALRAARVGGWSIDSRAVNRGDLFFAIKGRHFDGHRFVQATFEAGALAAVVSEPVHGPGAAVLE
ncbi:MAG: Mur ligase domain-containing protein, partial [Acidobacteriota bacterium]|nr:Mur ligase domain-containing protein [Acidobacteriota bacterium]